MKNMMKLLNVVVALLFTVSTGMYAETLNIPAGTVRAIYDYSDFSACGTYTKVTDNVNNKITLVYANARITGHTGTDGNFITESKTYLNGKGMVTKTEDVINKSYQVFNDYGRITSAYSVSPIDGQTYNASISHASDGSYTISWNGKFSDGKTGVTSKESYSAAGKITTRSTYNSSGTEDSKVAYTYDSSGDNIVKETESVNGKTVAVTTYNAGYRQQTVSYLSSGTSYVSAKYDYTAGGRISTVVSYDADKNASTTSYDKYGRVSAVKNSAGQVVSLYMYNDTTTAQKMSIVEASGSTINTTVAAGGLLKKVDTVYATDGSVGDQTISIFHGGISNMIAGTGVTDSINF